MAKHRDDDTSRALNHSIGRRIRLRRKQLKITLTQLGYSVGLTFQQIQKYGSGSNRISASLLWKMSQELDVPVTYFYAGPTCLGADRTAAERDMLAARCLLMPNELWLGLTNVARYLSGY